VTPKATSGGAAPSVSASSADGAASVKPTGPTSRPSTQPSPPDVNAPLVTSTESARRSKEAQDLVSKAMQALKDKKFDEARAALDKVDAMGSDIPKTTRENATTVRKSLDNRAEAAERPRNCPRRMVPTSRP
jgi:hypothetical protein